MLFGRHSRGYKDQKSQASRKLQYARAKYKMGSDKKQGVRTKRRDADNCYGNSKGKEIISTQRDQN